MKERGREAKFVRPENTKAALTFLTVTDIRTSETCSALLCLHKPAILDIPQIKYLPARL